MFVWFRKKKSFSQGRVTLAKPSQRLLLLFGFLCLLSIHPTSAQTTKTENPLTPQPTPPKKQQKSFIIPYRFVLDGKIAGDVPVEIDREGKIKLAPADVADALKSKITPEAYAELKAQTTRIPPEDFDKRYPLKQDSASQVLILDISLDKRAMQDIALGSQGFNENLNLYPLSDVSAYLNIIPTLSYTHQSMGAGAEEGYERTDIFLDGAMRLFGEKGLTFEGGGNLTDAKEGKNFTRNDMRVVYDIPEKIMRFTLGDLNNNIISFQDGQRIAGLSIASDFSLQPASIFRPTGQRSVDIERDSEVDVLINGAKLKTLDLKAGRYNLNDFPYSTGSNDVEIIIRDKATGLIQTLRFSNYQDFTQLGDGIHDYSYNVGVVTEFDNSNYKYQQDKPVFTAYHRYGVNDDVTAGVNMQSSKTVTAGGIEALWGTIIGLLGADSAVSQSDTHGAGTAFNLRHRFQASPENINGDIDKPFSSYSLTSSATHFSEKFVGILDIPASIRYSFNESASTNLSRNHSVFLNGQYDINYDDSVRMGASVGHSWRLNDTLSLLSQLRYSDVKRGSSAVQGDDVSAFFTLSWRPYDRHNVTASYETETKTASLDYTKQTYDYVGETGYAAGIAQNLDEDDIDVRGNVNHIGNRYRFSANSNSNIGNLGGTQQSWNSSVQMGTALAFADGKVALSRPIFDSFAIVDKHKTAKDAKIYVNKREEGYIAETDFLGAAVVPNMFPYYPNSVTTDVEDIPVGYDLGAGQYNIIPAYKSGTAITIGSDYTVTVIGQIDKILAEKLFGVLAYIESPDDKNFERRTAFVNRSGRFVPDGGLKAGKNYTIRFLSIPEYHGSFSVPDPKGQSNFIKLKSIPLEKKG